MVSPDQSSTVDTSGEDTLQMSPERESKTEKKRNGQRGRMMGQHRAVDNHDFFSQGGGRSRRKSDG